MVEGAIPSVDLLLIAAFFRTKISPHHVGLCDVLATPVVHDRQPKQVVLIGVEPQSFALSMELTPEIAACIPEVVQALATKLREAGVELNAA